jgi:hypothetical protein
MISYAMVCSPIQIRRDVKPLKWFHCPALLNPDLKVGENERENERGERKELARASRKQDLSNWLR